MTVRVLGSGARSASRAVSQLEAEARSGVLVRAADPAALADLAQRAGWDADRHPDGATLVRGVSAPELGHQAFVSGLELHELQPIGSDLESMFFQLVSPEYVGHAPGSAPGSAPGPAQGMEPVQQPVATSKGDAR